MALSTEQPTYTDIGATIAGSRPDGYYHDYCEAEIGQGSVAFERAVSGLQQWKAHQVVGIRVFPDSAELLTGVTVIVTLGTALVALAAPCRIVGVIDEPDRWGFAYGTLPGHPEQGEECFVVSCSDNDVIRFEIIAFSRPGDSLTRVAGPIGRAVQKRATSGYLNALRRFVGQGT